MSIPFTRNGKLDDTYDTKDSVFTLYTKITASGLDASTGSGLGSFVSYDIFISAD